MDQETKGTQDPQQRLKMSAAQWPASSDLVADLLRDRLATKLTEDELTSLIKDVREASEPKKQSEEDRISRLKSSIDYIEYKCRKIEKSLRATDRHGRPRDRERRERVFRDSLGIPFGGLFPVTSTRFGPTLLRSRN